MSKDLSLEDTSEAVSREPKYSPMFMSPGGSFRKPQKPQLPLSPAGISSISSTDKISIEEAPKIGELNDIEPSLMPDNVFSASNQDTILAEDGVSWGVRRGDVCKYGLFGGAIIVELPAAFTDASAVRQVPDNQEVFVEKDTDVSIVIELLESAEVSDVEACDFHFRELADCNQAELSLAVETRIFSDAVLPNIQVQDCTKAALVGVQKAKKFRSPTEPTSTVHIVLIVLRLPGVGTDCLISVNIPFLGADDDVSAGVPSISSFSDISSKESVSTDSIGIHALRMILETFGIVDWSLFA
jgi:hypothetical protein